MSPEFEKLIENNKRSDIVIARLEGSINQKIAEDYGISGFPALVLYEPESIDFYSIYNGDRTFIAMNNFLQEFCVDIPLKIIPEVPKDDISDNFLGTNDSLNLNADENNQILYIKDSLELDNLGNNTIDLKSQSLSSDSLELIKDENVFELRQKYINLLIRYKTLKSNIKEMLNIDQDISGELLNEYIEYYQFKNFSFFSFIFIGMSIIACIYILLKVYNKIFL